MPIRFTFQWRNLLRGRMRAQVLGLVKSLGGLRIGTLSHCDFGSTAIDVLVQTTFEDSQKAAKNRKKIRETRN